MYTYGSDLDIKEYENILYSDRDFNLSGSIRPKIFI